MIKIKKQYENHFIGFKGAKGRPLGQLDQDSLETLAKIALSANDKSVLDVFDGPLPSLTDLKKAKLLQSAPKTKEADKVSSKNDLKEGSSNSKS